MGIGSKATTFGVPIGMDFLIFNNIAMIDTGKSTYYLDIKDLKFIAYQVDPSINKPVFQRIPDSHWEVSQAGDMFKNVKIYCDFNSNFITKIVHSEGFNQSKEVDLSKIRI